MAAGMIELTGADTGISSSRPLWLRGFGQNGTKFVTIDTVRFYDYEARWWVDFRAVSASGEATSTEYNVYYSYI
jgi:hypothetical protein